MSGNAEYRGMVWQIAEDYACADLLLRLPGHCPMPVRSLPHRTLQKRAHLPQAPAEAVHFHMALVRQVIIHQTDMSAHIRHSEPIRSGQ